MAEKSSNKPSPDIISQLTAQRDLALDLAAAVSLDDAMALCVETAMRVSNMDCGSAYLLDEDSGSYILVYYRGVSDAFAHATNRWEKGSLRWEMIHAGNPVFTVYDRVRFSDLPEITAEGLRAVAFLPVLSGGKVIASFNLGSHTQDDIPATNRLAVETIVSQIGNGISRLRAEKALRDSSETFNQFMDNLPGFAIVRDSNNRILYANQRAHTFFGAPNLIGRRLDDMISPEDIHKTARSDQAALVDGLQVELSNMRDAAGRDHILINYKFPVRRVENNPVFGEIALDITDRRKAEEKIQTQLEHLASLRTIDLAITSSLNLDVTLDVLVKETIEQLAVDAVAVLLPDGLSGSLKMKAAEGLPSGNKVEIGLFLAEGIARTAVSERQSQQCRDGSFNGSPLSESGFVDGLAVPLIAKDLVKGVLVLLSRRPISPDADWLEFLDALSTQAAIAIDSITQYEELQNFNVTLTKAYDKTIEGWARTLELRDQETANHMQRVVDMTEQIARALGFPENEMSNLRRGAVLHDIGKIAIPDYIFFKPDKLNEAEWRIMRRHPEFARSMMAQIDFLSAAVDIPGAHHEHWDGAGYPRGLKGEDIPLAARIFAVADVWDALHADRPYRLPWSDDEAVNYIKKMSGKQFDPLVVDVFLKIIENR